MRKTICLLLYIIIYITIILIIKKYFSHIDIDIIFLLGSSLGILYSAFYWAWASVADEKDKEDKDK